LPFFIESKALSMPTSSGPKFHDIEYRYSRDAGRASILQAIPIGNSLEKAEAIRRGAGARCKPRHRKPEAIRCFYNEMSNDGSVIDDIRWTTILQVRDGHVVEISVDREVDTRVTG
jgi:hypothetical protein